MIELLSKHYEKAPCTRIGDADRNALFEGGLEYNSPARGGWNIVHTGMLVPEAHQIYVCAQGCLRGVILTAAEMNAMERLSWITLTEEDMFDGTLESDIVDGVTDLLHKMPKHPPVILLYISCMHLFAGADFESILAELHEKFPDIHFTDCYMAPTMRKTFTPTVRMAERLYEALKPLTKNPKAVAIIGNDRPTDTDSELLRIFRDNGFALHDITLCKTYKEYLQIAEASYAITYLPTAYKAGANFESQFSANHLHLPASFDYDKIAENYRTLCNALQVLIPDFSDDTEKAESALKNTKAMIGDIPIAIDYLAVSQPFSLAKLLLEHDFNVRHIIADTVTEDADAFDWLKENYPDIMIYQDTNVNMLYADSHDNTFAIGQKAAYYFHTDQFVNLVANGGYYGFTGISKIAELMADGFLNKKPHMDIIKLKGYGCPSCLTE